MFSRARATAAIQWLTPEQAESVRAYAALKAKVLADHDGIAKHGAKPK